MTSTPSSALNVETASKILEILASQRSQLLQLVVTLDGDEILSSVHKKVVSAYRVLSKATSLLTAQIKALEAKTDETPSQE